MKPKDIFVAHPPTKTTKPPSTPEEKKTQELLSELNKPLLDIHSLFPFQLFPDELIVNPVEVIYINNIFFWTSYRTNLLIEDIGDVTLVEGPVFASVAVLPTSIHKNPTIHMNYLTREKARKAHALIQGLITIQKEKIDIEELLSRKNGVEEIISAGQVNE